MEGTYQINFMAGNRLRGLRQDRDFTQREIAAMLNCSQVCYSHYEIGRREIPIDCLVKLSEFFNVSVDYILGLTDCKERYPKRVSGRGCLR